MRTLFTIFSLFLFLSVSAQQFNLETTSPALLEELEAHPGEKIPFYILLEDQVDVLKMKDQFKARKVTKDQRSHELITTLQAKADATQGAIINYLNNSPEVVSGSVKGYWVTNVVYAEGSAKAISEISRRSDVMLLEPQYKYTFEEVDYCAAPQSPNGREPGHTTMNAHKVWERGYSGYGSIVMTIDSGVFGNHRALRNNWRGLYFPGQGYTGNKEEQLDCSGHGTTVTGCMVGLNRVNNDTIGVAFNAQWINSPLTNLETDEDCEPEDEDAVLGDIAALQFAMNPDGNTATSSDVPIVVNHSYGTNANCWNNTTIGNILKTVETAGIASIWSAGNDGEDIGPVMSVNSQASINHTELNAFSVGATRQNSVIAGFSSRGPSLCNDTGGIYIKPEVVAPGVSIRTTANTGGYASPNGTSFSAPYVSGAIALLSEAFPDAIGEDLKRAIYETATDLGDTGEDNSYGNGMINIDAAFEYLEADFAVFDPTVTNDVIGIYLDVENIICGGELTGTVSFQNGGTTNLTSVDMNYQLVDDAGMVLQSGTWPWTGNLALGADAEEYEIPATSAPEGRYDVVIEFVNPNNATDEHPFNNKIIRDVTLFGASAVIPEIVGGVDPCESAQALLSLDLGEEATIEWYLNTNLLATGPTYLTGLIPPTFTFFVDALQRIHTGIENRDETTSEFAANTGGLVFDAATNVKIVSVKVYSEFNGARWIRVLDKNDNELWSSTAVVPVGETVIDINLNLLPDTDYKMVMGAGAPLASTNTPAFPYEIPSVFRIKSSTDVANPEDNYYFFYDFVIEHRFVCGPQPLDIAFISNAGATPSATFDVNVNIGGVANFTNTSANGVSYFWNFGDGSTSTSENPAHEYTYTGVYQVSLTTTGPDGCADTEILDLTVDEVTNLTELEASNQIKVYPNPTQSRLNIQFDFAEAQPVNLTVMDLLGRTLETRAKQNYLSDQVEIDLQNYSEGIYYLVFDVAGVKVVKKVVKMN